MIRTLRVFASAGVALAVVICAITTNSVAADDALSLPSGDYKSEEKHRYISFSYSHSGLSYPVLRWRDWEAVLEWNAEDAAASRVLVTIDASSIDSGVDEFDGHLKDERFFDVANHPSIAFASTSLEQTAPNEGTMTGDLTIKGVTKPVTLKVKMNNAYYDKRGKQHKVGFSATGIVKRSDFGIDLYTPNVGDDVTVNIEAEFIKPDAE